MINEYHPTLPRIGAALFQARLSWVAALPRGERFVDTKKIACVSSPLFNYLRIKASQN
jgi:hypothetical protein